MKPTIEDKAHGISYALGAAWAVVFFLRTPAAFDVGLDRFILGGWMAVTLVGAVMAIAGVILRIDLKLELPGVIIMAIGPALYALQQGFLVFSGEPGRDALTIFALWLVASLAPRAFGLGIAARKEKRIAQAESRSER